MVLVGPRRVIAATLGIGPRANGRHLASLERPASVGPRDGHATSSADLG